MGFLFRTTGPKPSPLHPRGEIKSVLPTEAALLRNTFWFPTKNMGYEPLASLLYGFFLEFPCS